MLLVFTCFSFRIFVCQSPYVPDGLRSIISLFSESKSPFGVQTASKNRSHRFDSLILGELFPLCSCCSVNIVQNCVQTKNDVFLANRICCWFAGFRKKCWNRHGRGPANGDPLRIKNRIPGTSVTKAIINNGSTAS